MHLIRNVIAGIIATALILACSHVPAPKEAAPPKASYDWHDGSKGGLYGIGERWSVELFPGEYEIVTETVISSHRNSELISIPAVYEWVEDEGEDLTGEPIIVPILVTLPAEYEIVTETLVIEPAKTEYFLSSAEYDSKGGILKPRRVGQRLIPAVTEHRERRVVKTPERTVEHMLPRERRRGYRRVIKTPAMTIESDSVASPVSITRRRVIQPRAFVIINPEGEVSHSFGTFREFTAFADSLK